LRKQPLYERNYSFAIKENTKMREFFTKEDLSTSAKEIKKTLAEQHTAEIGQSQILSILAKSIGFDSYKDFINGTGYVTYSSLDLITIKEKEEKIIKSLSKYGVIKTIKMIENYRNKQRKNFNENTYTYNLVEYMKIYDELNNRKISEDIIDTFDKAYDQVPELVSDLIKRYKDYPFYLNRKGNLLSNDTKLTTEDLAKFKEMSAIKRKISKNEDLTIVDELIIDLLYTKTLFSDYEDKNNIDKLEIIKKYRKEIVRLRGLHEVKSNYENLASEIDTYFFESSDLSSQAIIQEYKENAKKGSVFLGTLEKKEKKKFSGFVKNKT
jgi:DNA-binding Lrp family transcriptional regulator